MKPKKKEKKKEVNTKTLDLVVQMKVLQDKLNKAEAKIKEMEDGNANLWGIVLRYQKISAALSHAYLKEADGEQTLAFKFNPVKVEEDLRSQWISVVAKGEL